MHLDLDGGCAHHFSVDNHLLGWVRLNPDAGSFEGEDPFQLETAGAPPPAPVYGGLERGQDLGKLHR